MLDSITAITPTICKLMHILVPADGVASVIETVIATTERLRALQNHIGSFDILATACEEHRRGANHCVVFAPDHGAHFDPLTGKGTHSEVIPDNIAVTHFFGSHGR